MGTASHHPTDPPADPSANSARMPWRNALTFSIGAALWCILIAALATNLARDRSRANSLHIETLATRATLSDLRARFENDFGNGVGIAVKDARRAEELRALAIEAGWNQYADLCEKHGHLRIEVIHSAYDDRGTRDRLLSYRVHVPANRNLVLKMETRPGGVDIAPWADPPPPFPLAAGGREISMTWSKQEAPGHAVLKIAVDGAPLASFDSALPDIAGSFSVPPRRDFTKRNELPPQLVLFAPTEDFATHNYNDPKPKLTLSIAVATERKDEF